MGEGRGGTSEYSSPQKYEKDFLKYISLTLMLQVADFANTKWCKNVKEWLKPWHMDTHLRVLSESYLMNTNMTGIRWSTEIFESLYFRRK